MKLLLLSSIMMTMCVNMGVAQTPKIVNQLERDLVGKRLQGIWLPKLLVTSDGAQKYPVAGRAMIIQGTDFARTEGDFIVQSGTIELFLGDQTAIDFIITNRVDWDFERANTIPEKNLNRQKARLKIDGDMLTIVFSQPGRARPDDFTATAKTQVIVFNRQIEAKKEEVAPAIAKPPAKDNTPIPK